MRAEVDAWAKLQASQSAAEVNAILDAAGLPYRVRDQGVHHRVSGQHSVGGTAQGVVAGERFTIEVDGGAITGNLSAVFTAKTPDLVPARQVCMEGLPRPTLPHQ